MKFFLCAITSVSRAFLCLWKDAHPDIPILKQATAEHAMVQ
jgi:hypothetical protein